MDARKIKSKMALNGLTQAQLCELLGLSLSSFNAKLNGHRTFTLDEAEKICDALGINALDERAAIFLSSDVHI